MLAAGRGDMTISASLLEVDGCLGERGALPVEWTRWRILCCGCCMFHLALLGRWVRTPVELRPRVVLTSKLAGLLTGSEVGVAGNDAVTCAMVGDGCLESHTTRKGEEK